MVELVAKQPKNVIFIMADDLGIGDISYYHRQRTTQAPLVETPNMDALIQEGMRFNRAYSFAALCAPTRYSVATGRYATRSRTTMGDWTFVKPSSITKNIKTYGHVAKEAGYKTSFFGKYSLGGTFYEVGSDKTYTGGDYYTHFTVGADGPLPDVARGFKSDMPSDKGFDYSYIVPSGHQAPPHAFFENGRWAPIAKDSKIVNLVTEKKYDSTGEGVVVPKGSMLGDRGTKKGGPGPESNGIGDSHWDSRYIGRQLLDKALAFVDRHKNRPFFMAYHALAVHLPHTPPKTWRGKKLEKTHIHPHLDMVKEFDLAIGELRDRLKEHGLYEDTLIILTSDNGGLNMEGSREAGHYSNHTDRGYKCTGFEGGFHVPFVTSWPKQIQAHVDSDVLISTTDITATVYHMTGRDVPAHQALDSFSFWPHLFGASKAPQRESILAQGLFAGHWRSRIVRHGDYKLLFGEKKRVGGNMMEQFLGAEYWPIGLFNLVKDPQEKNNLVKNPEHKNLIEKISKTWTRYLDQVKNGERSTPLQPMASFRP
jgi:arylsulfatase A-like enzyme